MNVFLSKEQIIELAAEVNRQKEAARRPKPLGSRKTNIGIYGDKELFEAFKTVTEKRRGGKSASHQIELMMIRDVRRYGPKFGIKQPAHFRNDS